MMTKCFFNHSKVWSLIAASTIVASCAFAQDTSDFASKRLLDIASREEQIYKKIADDPEFYSAEDLDRRINELITSYRTYLTDNTEDVSAFVLYGKLLRRVDQHEQAFTAFLKADEIDPNIAVVKQQIGTYLAETGKGKAALTFYLRAADLEPEVALYHFSIGQLLFQFRAEFIEDNIFTVDAIDREISKAFRTAAALEPDNFDFQMRLGEAYYDLQSPDWKSALLHWDKLRKTTDETLQREIIDLHKARVLGKLGRSTEAKVLAATIVRPSLQQSKQQVLDEMSVY
jgi:tetratricopeptide (TPR) repeat protein